MRPVVPGWLVHSPAVFTISGRTGGRARGAADRQRVQLQGTPSIAGSRVHLESGPFSVVKPVPPDR